MDEINASSVDHDSGKEEGTRMKLYKRQKGHAIWHWCRECSEYPAMRNDVQATAYRPLTGQLCEECKKIEAKGACQK
jgi:hypothetical protein